MVEVSRPIYVFYLKSLLLNIQSLKVQNQTQRDRKMNTPYLGKLVSCNSKFDIIGEIFVQPKHSHMVHNVYCTITMNAVGDNEKYVGLG